MAVALTTTTAAFANERAVKQADVPKPVLAAVEARFPNAKFTHFAKEVEGGRTLYEVVLNTGSTHAEVSVSPEGEIVSEETTIGMSDLPAAVREGLASSKYGKAKVLRIERVLDAKKPATTTFEFMVEQAGKRHELAFDDAGELVHFE